MMSSVRSCGGCKRNLLAPVDADDAASFLARLSSGGMATFLATFYGTGERMNQGVEIFGQKGAIKMQYTDQESLWAAFEPFERDYQFAEHPIPEHFKTVSHDLRQNTIRKFVDAVADGEEMIPNFEDGLRNQRVIDAVVASARDGRWLEVPI